MPSKLAYRQGGLFAIEGQREGGVALRGVDRNSGQKEKEGELLRIVGRKAGHRKEGD